MRRSIWNKQIPTLLGVILLVGTVSAVSWMSRNNILFFSKAALQTTPKDVRITNVTDSSFSVSYLTDDRVVGTLSYGTGEALGKVIFDDRDQETGKPTAQILHHMTVRGLSPRTTYYFTINSGETNYQNKGAPFQVETAVKITTPPTKQTTLVGKISFPEGTPRVAIIYVRTDASQTLSLLTKPDGSYTLPMNTLRTSDLSAYTTLDKTTVITLLVIGENSQSRVTLSARQISPVPIVVLSENYDFTTTSEPLTKEATPSASSGTQTRPPLSGNDATGGSGFPVFGADVTRSSHGPVITTPKKDQAFTDQQPEFQGIAQPNTAVSITIHSEAPIQATVTTNSLGAWTFRPTAPLAPGMHTITIVTKDASGILQTISQSFTVYASGSQFVEPSGPPSPSPTTTSTVTTPTPTSAPQVTATPTVLPTIQPTTAPTATPTLAVSPSSTSLVTPFPTKSPPPLPKTGSTDLPAFLLGALALIGIGGVLFLLTKGVLL